MPPLPITTDNQDQQLAIDKELYDSALAVRDEMNLITERLSKMDEHKGEVSEAVYLRVKSDYLAKFDQVKTTFETKKQEIQKALQSLYKKQRDYEEELQKHQEILEEAKFRSFLGEYSDKKFKEIDGKENAELKRLENILSIIKGNSKQYEDIIGGPAPEPEVEAAVKPEPVPIAKEPAPAPKVVPTAAKPISRPTLTKVEEAPPPPPAAPDAFKEETGTFTEEGVTIEPVQAESKEEDYYLGAEEGDYFQSSEMKSSESNEPKLVTAKTKMPETVQAPPVEKLKTEKVRPIKAAPLPEEPVTSKTQIEEEPEHTPPKAAAAAKTSAGLGFDDSISSILRSIPLEEEEEERKETKSAEPAPAAKPEPEDELPSITQVEETGLKATLMCIEGELEPGQYELGENTSIGRSPSNDIVLKEAKVSRQHAAINFIRGSHVIVDLKSSNGILVNGEKVEEHVLQDGDEISVGSFKLLYQTE
ncbi:MAG: FHA domain-containing protein [bacterium]